MGTVQEAQEWLNDQTIEMWWGRGSKLTKDQVTLLVERGEQGLHEVQGEIWELNIDYIAEQEHAWRERAAERFDVDAEKLWPEMEIDYNLSSLIRGTWPYIAVTLGIRHEVYGDTIDYEHVEKELEKLGVNPADVRDDWPDMPERDDPLLDPDEVLDLWVNWYREGTYVALLHGQDVLRAIIKGDLDERTVLEKGATVTIYNFAVGGGSVLAYTNRPFSIDPDDIYHDGKSKWGIQSCYGLVGEVWNGELAKPEDD